jgi:hypothetical protein
MHPYRLNSPQAAARIVAVCLLADGHAKHDALEARDEDRICKCFALPPVELAGVLEEAHEALASTAHRNWHDACRDEPAIVRRLASELWDPALILDVVEFCEACAEQERRRTCANASVLQALCDAWRVPAESEWVRRCDAPARVA